MKIVILAGGKGNRLWPMSRRDLPKQFYPILSEQPMLFETYLRFQGSFPKEKIYISSVPEFLGSIGKLFSFLPRENIIVEPEKRDTAPAMGYVASHLFLDDPDEPVAFIPSDHYISPVEPLLQSLHVAEQVIQETGKMLDIGIQPRNPSTALGYTHIGEKYDNRDGIVLYRFRGHTEKPAYHIAKQYLESGEYLWHASFYMWTPRKFLEAYQKYAPHISVHLEKILSLLDECREKQKELCVERIREEYNAMEKTSFDYAVTEKMNPDDVLIIQGNFTWSDIGAWDVLYDHLGAKYDEQENLIKGRVIQRDTTHSLIYGSHDKVIAALGLSDMIIVDTEDALLICPKGRAQEVKQIVELLARKKWTEFL